MHSLKLCKNVSENISTFLVFISLVDHTVNIRTETCMKIVFKRFLPKITFFFF